MPMLARIVAPLRRRWRIAAVMLLCTSAGMVQAQYAANDSAADPPSRVARLSYMEGDLGFLPAGARDWSDASINRPLTTGDRLSSGRDSRAELELGGGTLRIAGRTDFGLLDLNDQIVQVELTQGTLSLTVRHLDGNQSYEIDTPTVALVVDQPGTFRVDAGDDGRGTRITAFDGDATVYGENSAQFGIHPGRSYRFDDSSLASVTISDISGEDAFDAWSRERDSRYAQSTTRQYVSDDVIGYQDLDRYGDWQTTSDYGAVWFPSDEDSDWAPYRDGHWAYIAPWGWTWVDDAPWGFAPYHYGRWVYLHGDWGWVPGPIVMRPVYAPALVAFVGGGGWSVGIGIGPVGWFPLGPGEIYNPWYRASRGYYTEVNITNIREGRWHHRREIIGDIDEHYNHYREDRPMRGEHYANRDAPRGFTAVPGAAFAGGRHVQRDLLRVDRRELAAAPVLPRGANLRPAPIGQTASRSLHARSLPAGGFRRDVVARHVPPGQPLNRQGPAAGYPTGPQRAGMPPANVRLLGSERGARPPGIGRIGSMRDTPARQRPGSGMRAGSSYDFPRTTNAAAPAAVTRDTLAEPRSGELPSARFAHPPATDTPVGDRRVNRNAAVLPPTPTYRRQPIPREGAGNFPDGYPQRRDNRSEPTLPAVPQIQRATPVSPPMPIAADRGAQRLVGRPTRRNDLPEPAAPAGYSTGSRRFEPRADNTRRFEPRTQPLPQSEPPRQIGQPRQQPSPPAMPHYQPPPARPEMARPQQRAVTPQPAATPRPRPPEKDERHQ
ncbi:MAG: hypothetical protein KGJ32_03930 [Xanthomonadaceae bacterium]|nr:hypothetical protein [Xanthomonadaceae bacterium]